MKNSVYIFIFSMIIGFVVGGLLMRKCSNTPEVIKTDTITVTDTMWRDTTVTIKEFIPKIIVKKKVDTVYTKEGDTLNLITESKRYDKSLVSDKDTCDLEIYTSGINTSLDSLKWRLKTHSVTNTIEITKYVEKKKSFKERFHLSPQVGGGFGLIKRTFDVYVGLGVSYDL